jgi:hypothetical protein
MAREGYSGYAYARMEIAIAHTPRYDLCCLQPVARLPLVRGS